MAKSGFFNWTLSFLAAFWLCTGLTTAQTKSEPLTAQPYPVALNFSDPVNTDRLKELLDEASVKGWHKFMITDIETLYSFLGKDGILNPVNFGQGLRYNITEEEYAQDNFFSEQREKEGGRLLPTLAGIVFLVIGIGVDHDLTREAPKVVADFTRSEDNNKLAGNFTLNVNYALKEVGGRRVPQISRQRNRTIVRVFLLSKEDEIKFSDGDTVDLEESKVETYNVLVSTNFDGQEKVRKRQSGTIAELRDHPSPDSDPNIGDIYRRCSVFAPKEE